MPGHRDIPDEVVKRAQLYDYENFRQDRAGQRGGSWGSVPPDQVRRLLWGAFPQQVREILDRMAREGQAAGLYDATEGPAPRTR